MTLLTRRFYSCQQGIYIYVCVYIPVKKIIEQQTKMWGFKHCFKTTESQQRKKKVLVGEREKCLYCFGAKVGALAVGILGWGKGFAPSLFPWEWIFLKQTSVAAVRSPRVCREAASPWSDAGETAGAAAALLQLRGCPALGPCTHGLPQPAGTGQQHEARPRSGLSAEKSPP